EMDRFTIDYSEAAAVGYKWVERQRLQPFPLRLRAQLHQLLLWSDQRDAVGEWRAQRALHRPQHGQAARHGGRTGLCGTDRWRMGGAEAPGRVREDRSCSGSVKGGGRQG